MSLLGDIADSVAQVVSGFRVDVLREDSKERTIIALAFWGFVIGSAALLYFLWPVLPTWAFYGLISLLLFLGLGLFLWLADQLLAARFGRTKRRRSGT
jgi:hypothetical protein